MSNKSKESIEPIRVPFSEWSPKEGQDLWARLIIHGNPEDKQYTSEFEKNNYWNTNATQLISSKDKLLHYLSQLQIVFAVEHFLENESESYSQPKILEIGTWPMENNIVPTSRNNTAINLLSQNSDYKVVGADWIPNFERYPHNHPEFGNAKYFNGNFLRKSVRQEIVDFLGGAPDIILGNMVFEQRLPQCQSGGEYAVSPFFKNLDGRLAEAANEMLSEKGVIAVCNRGYGKLTPFIEQLKLLYNFEDKDGTPNYVQIRQKK